MKSIEFLMLIRIILVVMCAVFLLSIFLPFVVLKPEFEKQYSKEDLSIEIYQDVSRKDSIKISIFEYGTKFLPAKYGDDVAGFNTIAVWFLVFAAIFSGICAVCKKVLAIVVMNIFTLIVFFMCSYDFVKYLKIGKNISKYMLGGGYIILLISLFSILIFSIIYIVTMNKGSLTTKVAYHI